jgi:hypothetical protein
MLVKIQILKDHYRAEDCRTIHRFFKDQIITVNQKLANEIIKDENGILFVEKQIIEEVKAIPAAPENKMFNAENLQNKSIVIEEVNEPVEIIEEVSEVVKPEPKEEIEILPEVKEVVEEKPIIPEPKSSNFNKIKKIFNHKKK